jgi:hypothetical protein
MPSSFGVVYARALLLSARKIAYKIRLRAIELLDHGYFVEAEDAWRITRQFIDSLPSSEGKDGLVSFVEKEAKRIADNPYHETISDSVKQIWKEIWAFLNSPNALR